VTLRLYGNLDCEARWAGVALPEAVQRRISLYATLFAACAPDDPEPGGAPHEIWVPRPIDPARLVAHPRWTPPIVHAGGPASSPPMTATATIPTTAPPATAPPATAPPATTPPATTPPAPATPRIDLAWADPAAREANDRSRTLAIAAALGVALPGACVVGSLDELDAHVAGFAGAAPRPWVCKARWTAAGRDRAHGAGGRVGGELRARLGRMLERFGPLVFEPWLDRVVDLGVCGEIAADGAVVVAEPHRVVTDPRGGFLGIELAPAIDRAIAEPLRTTAHAAAALVAAQTGYRGPFAIDAFVYRDAGAHHLHPLCELNARYTFGWIARGLARRLGIRRLGFDAPPHGATLLIAPGDDRVTAWCA
jgi:hypothetical protein